MDDCKPWVEKEMAGREEPVRVANGGPQAELPVPPGLENVYLITLNMVPAAMKALVDLGVFNILGKAGHGALLSSRLAHWLAYRSAGWRQDRCTFAKLSFKLHESAVLCCTAAAR